MTAYSVIYLPATEKFFRKAPLNISSHIFRNLEIVAKNPFAQNPNLKKLQDPLSGYRLRVGDYRAIYILDQATRHLIVVKIAHRSVVYL
jgi:mRNA interferase RelE/StbE